MRFFWIKLQLLLVVCLTLAEAKTRGEQDELPTQNERTLVGNVFNADALRHTLSTQRRPYESPFRNEPMKMTMLNLSARTINRQREWRAMAPGTARDGHVEVIEVAADEETATTTTTIMIIGKGSSSSSSSSSSKSSKSKGKGKGGYSSSSKSSKSSRRSRPKPKPPTLSPTVATEPPTTTPTVVPTPLVTGMPTCNPTGNFFPPSVVGFFMQPAGEPSALQEQLDSTLEDIQVPGEFQHQCVEGARF